jgi:hypothetical protein
MADTTQSASEQKKEDWMNSKWRPMMGWMYMLICTMDMVVFPILWSLLQAMVHGSVNSQWQPLTLQGAGLFHIAMGGVLGLAAYGRTQEKLAGANNGGATTPATGSSSGFTTPSAPASGGFGTSSSSFGSTPAPAAGAFGGSGFGSTPAPVSTPAFTAPTSGPTTVEVQIGFGGKPAPVQPPFPAI